MNPAVHSFVLKDKDPLVNVELYQQALILKMLFINQGFYNLMVAAGGILGVLLIAKGKESEGLHLLGYMPLFATVAGITLLFSSRAYSWSSPAGCASGIGHGHDIATKDEKQELSNSKLVHGGAV